MGLSKHVTTKASWSLHKSEHPLHKSKSAAEVKVSTGKMKTSAGEVNVSATVADTEPGRCPLLVTANVNAFFNSRNRVIVIQR